MTLRFEAIAQDGSFLLVDTLTKRAAEFDQRETAVAFAELLNDSNVNRCEEIFARFSTKPFVRI